MSKDTVNIKLIWTDEQKNPPKKNKITEMTILEIHFSLPSPEINSILKCQHNLCSGLDKHLKMSNQTESDLIKTTKR